jgi:modulator of FtsH protease HflC
MSNRLVATLLISLLVLVVASQSVFIVNENEKVVRLQFGKLVDANLKPGWYFKTPMVDDIKRFDGRIISLNAHPERFLTVEKKAMMVDLYAKLRIEDAAKYYKATSGDENRSADAIFRRINEGLRNEFGVRTLHEVVSGQRDELMVELTKKLNETVGSELGVEVVDVRVKRIDLPDEVSDDVYNRMRSERDREARKHRSEGKELAEGIRADADRQKVVLEGEAFRESEQIRGEGDAKAARIYAEAYNADPEFYSFLKSLQAYKASFNSRSDILLIDPNSSFFKYLNNPRGR